jgi:hypothetical protein
MDMKGKLIIFSGLKNLVQISPGFYSCSPAKMLCSFAGIAASLQIDSSS